ncbi:MAG: putative dehydrogenase, partial [Anaerocolumna sp.]|nr:putative dehydrogenase [Anaerocolumna sp.]
MDKIKIGIIGCGGIANGKHLPAIKRNGNFEIIAFC